MTPPIALNPEQVPDDLICSICMTVPIHPVITPCEHIFCRECIHQALEVSSQCPIDRVGCTIHQLREIRGCLSRIWGSIPVKCGSNSAGCAWTGSLGDYANHQERCNLGRSSRDVRNEIKALREESARLDNALRESKAKISRLNAKLASRPNLPTLFTGQYNYKRENVVQLSQLISRYLENKPSEIDSNRIFNCVRSCYMDLEKNYSDNPQFYQMDMKMLLATCAASTWFTNNQRSNIVSWLHRQ